MNNLFKILLTSFLILFCINCGKKDWRDEMDAENAKLEKSLEADHKKLLSLKKDSYSIENSSKSRDQAVVSYLQAMSKYSPGENPYSLNQKELLEILYPNSLGIGTSLDKTPLDNYQTIVWDRKIMAENKLNKKLSGNIKVLKVNWQENTRKYGALTGHKPDSIIITIDGKNDVIKEIKQVIEHNGQFKVAVVAP
jgi:hypothetical protein